MKAGFNGSEFGTPASDDYETDIDTWRNLLPFLGKDEVIYDPYWCTGKAGVIWTELGYKNIHRPLNFFDDLSLPVGLATELATVLVTK